MNAKRPERMSGVDRFMRQRGGGAQRALARTRGVLLFGLAAAFLVGCSLAPRSGTGAPGATIRGTPASEHQTEDIKPRDGASQSATRAQPEQDSVAAGSAPAIAAGSARGATSAAAPSPLLPQSLQPLPPVDRMIVKTGTLTVQVADLVDAVQRVHALLAGIPGAYIASSTTTYRAEPAPAASGPRSISTSASEGAGSQGTATQSRPPSGVPPISPPIPPRPPAPGQSATLTIKVPADAFGDALGRLRELGTPLAEHISTQEVTEEYVDLEAQVRNLEATEQQYLRLLERAQRIEEILPIQQRLNDVRNQIERLRGRMNLLQRRADTSTLTLTLVLPPAKAGPDPVDEPRFVRTFREAFASLGRTTQGLVDAAIYAVVYLLPLVPPALAVWWWRTRRLSAASRSGAAGAPGAPSAG